MYKGNENRSEITFTLGPKPARFAGEKVNVHRIRLKMDEVFSLKGMKAPTSGVKFPSSPTGSVHARRKKKL